MNDGTDNEFCTSGYMDYDFGFVDDEEDDKEETKKEENKGDLNEIITEVQKLIIEEGEVLVIKVPKDYMTDPDFIRQMRYVMESAFGKDKVQSGKVMMIPDDIQLEKVQIKKKHPIYGD